MILFIALHQHHPEKLNIFESFLKKPPDELVVFGLAGVVIGTSLEDIEALPGFAVVVVVSALAKPATKQTTTNRPKMTRFFIGFIFESNYLECPGLQASCMVVRLNSSARL